MPLVGYLPICTDLLSGCCLVQSDNAIAEQRGEPAT